MGCHDYTIGGSFGDGICCLNNYYDDRCFDDYHLDYYDVGGLDFLDDYCRGIIHDRQEVFDVAYSYFKQYGRIFLWIRCLRVGHIFQNNLNRSNIHVYSLEEDYIFFRFLM